ncbi:cysteine desulfurase-like protein [Nakamurella sp. YIM 132087]|uniref:Cysteine desulfurase-like protein n=1 Tax=Nakamurella alba TaxID=2665158 RepID=A0A7K1FT77_9ACTN|nr:cysteine desulfurase-like protein [Nakamurella alba]MTD16383.1 cysteine desulfurase-like protein [Nakamurella alba]
MTSLDVAAIRADFPSLASGIAHFDGPGGTQSPRRVGEAVAAALTGPLSNRGRAVLSERNSDDAVTAFRAAGADLLGADPRGIVHGRSATQLTYDFSRHLSREWGPEDEIVVSRLDHDANVRPWVQTAERTGAVLRWIDLDPATGEIDPDQVAGLLSARTRLVALTGASNLIGTRPPVRQVADLAHAAGALVFVDGVHLTAHARIDVTALGADFYVCSPYKFLGPHCGMLAADPALLEQLRPDKLLPSTDAIPERFEFGTLPYEQLAGATAAIDYLADLTPGPASRADRLTATYAALEHHEERLRGRIEDGLAALGDQVTVHSRAALRTPTLLVTFAQRSAGEVSGALAAADVLAPAGSFYAYEPARRLGLGADGGLRIGLAPYNDDTDVDRLLDGLQGALRS